MLDQPIPLGQQQTQKERSGRMIYLNLLLLLVAGCFARSSNETKAIWSSFNRDEVVRSIDNGEWVILFGNPLYNVEGKVFQSFLEQDTVVDKLKESRAKLYYLEYMTKEPSTEEFMQLTRKTYSPILAILHSTQTPEYFSIQDLEKFQAKLEQLVTKR
jgi:hypothetical protein